MPRPDGKPSLRYITLLQKGACAHGRPEYWNALLLESVGHAEIGLPKSMENVRKGSCPVDWAVSECCSVHHYMQWVSVLTG